MSAPCPQKGAENRRAASTPPRRRTRAVDPAARAMRWSKNGSSREARLYREVVRRLRQHVGGSPNHAQALVIGRVAWLQVHLAHLDERAMADGGLSPHAVREYLAWSNTIVRLIGRLGLEGSAPSMPTRAALADYLAGR